MIDSPEQLASILRREHDNAESFQEQLEELQRLAFEYYEAQPLRNEIDGRSQVVLPDVQETIDYMTQSVLRTMTTASRIVEFEATDEADEQAADDATTAIDYEFMRRQDGYRVLLDITNDGLLRKTGIIKAVMDKRERVVRSQEIMPAEALGLLDDSVEVEDVVENGDGTVSVTIKQTKIDMRATGVAVPTHEFLFSPNARHEDTCNYVAHVCPKTRGELVEMGFDREQVYGLPAWNRFEDHRYESDEIDNYYQEETTPAVEEVQLCEEYARIDIDNDGIAERVKVFRVENTILRYQGEPQIDEFGEPVTDDNGDPVYGEGELAIETVDEQPFSVFCPFPRPHHLVGYSLADKVMDIQYLRTMLARQMIDGMAFANLPRPIVAEQGSGDNTLDDILNPIPGSPIRVKAVGAVTPMTTNFNIGGSLQAMEWATGERESRTGITRLNQGLDADTLNKTATGTAMMQAQGQQIEEFIARNLAETLARFFMKLYRLMREAGQPFKIKVDGQYRMIDPSGWPEEMCMKVNVGLGTNSKDKRIQARMAMYQPLTLAMSEGLAGAEHAYKWMDGMARDTGLGTGDDFMFNPEDPEVMARKEQEGEQPDPAMEEMKAKLALEQTKAEANIQLQRDKADADIATQRAKHELDMRVAMERATLDDRLARDKAAAEIRLAEERMRAEIAMKQNLQDNRPGGDLDK